MSMYSLTELLLTVHSHLYSGLQHAIQKLIHLSLERQDDKGLNTVSTLLSYHAEVGYNSCSSNLAPSIPFRKLSLCSAEEDTFFAIYCGNVDIHSLYSLLHHSAAKI